MPSKRMTNEDLLKLSEDQRFLYLNGILITITLMLPKTIEHYIYYVSVVGMMCSVLEYQQKILNTRLSAQPSNSFANVLSVRSILPFDEYPRLKSYNDEALKDDECYETMVSIFIYLSKKGYFHIL